MSLDRPLQLCILKKLAEVYPAKLDHIEGQFDADPEVVIKNIYYLFAHRLVDVVFSREIGPRVDRPGLISITHHGMDFLADDGGLGAILGVVTVKLHEDTIRQLISWKIEGSDLPEAEKRSLLQAVRELPGEAIKHLTTKLLDLGMDNLPAATELIHKVLQSLGR